MTLASFKALRAQARFRTSFLRRDAFCENRLFFKSITTATACLAGRLSRDLYGRVFAFATALESRLPAPGREATPGKPEV